MYAYLGVGPNKPVPKVWSWAGGLMLWHEIKELTIVVQTQTMEGRHIHHSFPVSLFSSGMHLTTDTVNRMHL